MPMGTAVSCSSTSAPMGAAMGIALLAGETTPLLMLESRAETSCELMASVSFRGRTAIRAIASRKSDACCM